MITRESLQSIDPRQLGRFTRMSEFRASLTPEESEAVQYRMTTAHWTQEERLVYDAVQEGYTDMDSLPIATGLTTAQIRSAIEKLQGKGYVKEVIIPTGTELGSTTKL